jgi:ABC transport system ATP-binding/permease protein
MFFKYWLVLFSTWTASNIMGLLISDSFKTVVTIYILIPFLVIPQIILSGVIVKYEKLNPRISSPSKIPAYGEMMTARWGYEALAVEQFMHNKYDEEFYSVNKVLSISEYKKNYWIKNLENKIDFIEHELQVPADREKTSAYLALLRNELEAEIPNIRKIPIQHIQSIVFPSLSMLTPERINQTTIDSTRQFIKTLNRIYIRSYNKANEAKDNLIRAHEKTPSDKAAYLELKRRYHNEKLTEFVENNNELVRIIEYKGRLFQKIDPIYLDPVHPFIKAHFYAPRKMLFRSYFHTFWVNILVIWTFSLIIYFLLYFRLLKRILDLLEQISSQRSNQ